MNFSTTVRYSSLLPILDIITRDWTGITINEEKKFIGKRRIRQTSYTGRKVPNGNDLASESNARRNHHGTKKVFKQTPHRLGANTLFGWVQNSTAIIIRLIELTPFDIHALPPLVVSTCSTEKNNVRGRGQRWLSGHARVSCSRYVWAVTKQICHADAQYIRIMNDVREIQSDRIARSGGRVRARDDGRGRRNKNGPREKKVLENSKRESLLCDPHGTRAALCCIRNDTRAYIYIYIYVSRARRTEHDKCVARV